MVAFFMQLFTVARTYLENLEIFGGKKSFYLWYQLRIQYEGETGEYFYQDFYVTKRNFSHWLFALCDLVALVLALIWVCFPFSKQIKIIANMDEKYVTFLWWSEQRFFFSKRNSFSLRARGAIVEPLRNLYGIASCFRACTTFEPLLTWVFSAIKARALRATFKCETLVTIVLWKKFSPATSRVHFYSDSNEIENIIKVKTSRFDLSIVFDTRGCVAHAMAAAVIKTKLSYTFNEWNVEHKSVCKQWSWFH